MDQNLHLVSENCTLRKRPGKGNKEEEEVAKMDLEDYHVETWRQVVIILVGMFVVGYTGYMLDADYSDVEFNAKVLVFQARKCSEMNYMNHVVKRLGLDELPGYAESSCFSRSERLGAAIQPATEAVAAVLKDVKGRLHRTVLRLVWVVTAGPPFVYRHVARGIRHLVHTKSDGATTTVERMTTVTRPDDTSVIQGQESVTDEDTEVTPLYVGHFDEDIPATEATPSDGGSEEEGDSIVPEEMDPARQSVARHKVGEHSDDSAALVLTKDDLKTLLRALAALVGKEVGEESLDALVHSIGSRKSSQDAQAGQE